MGEYHDKINGNLLLIKPLLPEKAGKDELAALFMNFFDLEGYMPLCDEVQSILNIGVYTAQIGIVFNAEYTYVEDNEEEYPPVAWVIAHYKCVGQCQFELTSIDEKLFNE